MNDALQFSNPIRYMVVSPEGEVTQRGIIHNAVGIYTKTSLYAALGMDTSAYVATNMRITGMAFRTDGSAILGSFAQWYAGTAYATVYGSVTSPTLSYTGAMFYATYTATSNVTIRSACLYNVAAGITSPTNPVWYYCHAYSTLFNMSCGSGGQIIIQWTVNLL